MFKDNIIFLFDKEKGIPFDWLYSIVGYILNISILCAKLFICLSSGYNDIMQYSLISFFIGRTFSFFWVVLVGVKRIDNFLLFKMMKLSLFMKLFN